MVDNVVNDDHKYETRYNIDIVRYLHKSNGITTAITCNKDEKYVISKFSKFNKGFVLPYHVMEMNILQKLQNAQCDNIPEIYDTYVYHNTITNNRFLCYDMKLYDGDLFDLFDYTLKHSIDIKHLIPIIIEDIGNALSHVHDLGYSHNDIKVENIVYYVDDSPYTEILDDTDYNTVNKNTIDCLIRGEYERIHFVLIDYGHANHKDAIFTTVLGTHSYASPYVLGLIDEVGIHIKCTIQNSMYGNKIRNITCDYKYKESDIWSLACNAYYLYTRIKLVKTLYTKTTILENLKNAVKSIDMNRVNSILYDIIDKNIECECIKSDVDKPEECDSCNNNLVSTIKWMIKTFNKGISHMNNYNMRWKSLDSMIDDDTRCLFGEYIKDRTIDSLKNHRVLAVVLCYEYTSADKTLKTVDSIFNSYEKTIDNLVQLIVLKHRSKRNHILDVIKSILVMYYANYYGIESQFRFKDITTIYKSTKDIYPDSIELVKDICMSDEMKEILYNTAYNCTYIDIMNNM